MLTIHYLNLVVIKYVKNEMTLVDKTTAFFNNIKHLIFTHSSKQ